MAEEKNSNSRYPFRCASFRDRSRRHKGTWMNLRCVAIAFLCCAMTAACLAQTSGKEARRRAEVGVKALQRWYVPRTGLYRTTGWWNSANAITAVTDLMRVRGEKKYVGVLKTTFVQAQIAVPKEQQTVEGKEMTGFPGFLNKYYDDEGWWALAWI